MRSTKQLTEIRLEDGTVVELIDRGSTINMVVYSTNTFHMDAYITKRDARELAAALEEIASE